MKSEECLEFLKQCALSERPKQAMPRCRTSQCTMDKLDQDFILYLSFAFECLENLKHSKHLDTCKLWFSKLCAEHYTTIAAKRTRNLYLSKLILNIQDGQFNSVFLSPPSSEQEELPICENIFLCHTKPSDPAAPIPGCEPVNQGIDISNYIHLSRDGRTYVATKPIPNGVMSYVAVTLGGETPQWMNKDGEPLPFPSNNVGVKIVTADPGDGKYMKVGRHLNEEEHIRQRKKRILARRKPQNDRTQLIHFYDEILRRIDVEMEELVCKTCVENKDPFIKQLTKKLQSSLVSQSTTTDTVQNINRAVGKRKVLLAMLRSNIENQKRNIFVKREILLSRIEKTIEREEKELQNKTEFQFIKPQSLIISNEEDYKSTIWGTILNEQMHPKHVCLLKRKYCFQLATVLQSLLKEDKVKIINQTQGLAGDIEEQMMRGLQEEIQTGLMRFSNARQEWIKIQNVLKEIEKIRVQIMKGKMECVCNASIACNTKVNLLDTCAQVNNMKLKLECVNKRNEDLVRNIKIVHGKIHQVTEQNIACQDELNCEYEHMKFCVTQKRNEIRDQELAIAKFKA